MAAGGAPPTPLSFANTIGIIPFKSGPHQPQQYVSAIMIKTALLERNIESVKRLVSLTSVTPQLFEIALAGTNVDTVLWVESLIPTHLCADTLNLCYYRLLLLAFSDRTVDFGFLYWVQKERATDTDKIRALCSLDELLGAQLPLRRLQWLCQHGNIPFVATTGHSYLLLASNYPHEEVVDIVNWLVSLGAKPNSHLISYVLTSSKRPRELVELFVKHGAVATNENLESIPERLNLQGCYAPECIELTLWLLQRFLLQMTSGYASRILDYARVSGSADLMRWVITNKYPTPTNLERWITETKRSAPTYRCKEMLDLLMSVHVP